MRVRTAVYFVVLLGAAIACGTPTTLTAVWKAPGVTGVRFQKSSSPRRTRTRRDGATWKRSS
jgi:hypothetical protein